MASADLSDLKAVYLIYGEQELLLDRAVRRLKERLAEVADLDFNMENFDGANAVAEEIVNAANTMPFMSDKRLVIVRDVDKMDAESLNRLAAYAKDPAPYTCLVLVARKINKGSKLYRAADALGGAYEYAAPKRWEYATQVAGFFREHAKSISPQAAQAMVDLVGQDLRRLDSEVDKVVAFVGSRDTVTPADIDAVVSAGAPTSVFDFVDAVGSRDTALALRLLSGLMASGESEFGLLAMTVRHMRALVGARALVERRMRSDEMAPKLGVPPWQVKKLVEQAGNFSPDELSLALRGLAAVEAQMKTSPVDPGLVLERWVVGVTRRVETRQ